MKLRLRTDPRRSAQCLRPESGACAVSSRHRPGIQQPHRRDPHEETHVEEEGGDRSWKHPAEELEKAQAMHKALVEAAAENDES